MSTAVSLRNAGYNTDFQKEIEQTGLQQNHHIAFYGGSSESSYRVSLGFMDRQGVILNEDMKNFTSNMNMNQKMFDGFLNCELGMFGSIQKNHNLVDYQKTFYSAATFNPTYPNHKDPVTNSWDGITTASQITNPPIPIISWKIRNTSPPPSGRTARLTKEPKSENPCWAT